jgi:amino acid transporter
MHIRSHISHIIYGSVIIQSSFFGIESASPSLHQTRDQSRIPLAFNVLVCVRRIPVGMRYTKEQITDFQSFVLVTQIIGKAISATGRGGP